MAHELSQLIDGRFAMFSVAQTPWHGLGQVLDQPPTIEEGLRQAGLDWEVGAFPLYTNVNGLQIPTGGQAIIRLTDNKVLGEVGADYKPVQNTECFKFFDVAVENGLVTLETAGSLKDDTKVWVLAKIANTTQEVVDGDPVNAYFLLSNSHDGTSSVRVGPTAIRVVCQNTLSAANRDKRSKLISVRHTKNVKEGLERLKEIVDWHRNQFVASVEQMKHLASVGCNEDDLFKYVKKVFEPEIKARHEDSEESADKAFQRIMNKVIPLWENGRGTEISGVRGSFWGAYNSISELLSWAQGRTADTRLDSLWFGQNAKVNDRAFEVALNMAAKKAA